MDLSNSLRLEHSDCLSHNRLQQHTGTRNANHPSYPEQNIDNRLDASHTSRIWLLLVQISYIANDGRNTLGQHLARSHRHLAICWHQEIQPQACWSGRIYRLQQIAGFARATLCEGPWILAKAVKLQPTQTVGCATMKKSLLF